MNLVEASAFAGVLLRIGRREQIRRERRGFHAQPRVRVRVQQLQQRGRPPRREERPPAHVVVAHHLRQREERLASSKLRRALVDGDRREFRLHRVVCVDV
eukprot:31148-Pelagococcus_subviridis.AAC.5